MNERDVNSLLRSYENGEAKAGFSLAWMYFTGEGVDENQREAACIWHDIISEGSEKFDTIYHYASKICYSYCCLYGCGIYASD